jgi:hypothetical protein
MAVRKGRYLALLMIALVTAVCLRLAVLLALVTLAAVLARLTLATLLLLAAALVVLMAALLALVGVVLGLALLIRVLAVAALTALLTVGLVLVVLIVGVVGHDASPCAGDRCNVADGVSSCILPFSLARRLSAALAPAFRAREAMGWPYA